MCKIPKRINREGGVKILRVAGVLFLCAVVAGFGQTHQSAFFRISNPSNAIITGFDPNAGTLTCSNAVAGTTNQLQRSYDLTSTSNWVDFIQLASNALVVTEVIIDLNPPEGMAFIPGGVFQMGDSYGGGDSDERPVHSAYVSGFYMGTYELTNDEMVEAMQWAHDNGKLVVSSSSVKNAQGNQQELLNLDDADCRITWDGSVFGIKSAKGSGYPCVEVSWYGSAAYCNYRSEKEGRAPCYNLADWSCNFSANGYRLPTEAEWEKAARGGLNGKQYGGGDSIDHSKANYDRNPVYAVGAYPYTSPAGSFAPSGYGLHDMEGNLWEWCSDWYEGAYYATSPSSNPRGPSAGSSRVLRGGSWYSLARNCRSAYRQRSDPSGTGEHLGFRAVLPAK